LAEALGEHHRSALIGQMHRSVVPKSPIPIPLLAPPKQTENKKEKKTQNLKIKKEKFLIFQNFRIRLETGNGHNSKIVLETTRKYEFRRGKWLIN